MTTDVAKPRGRDGICVLASISYLAKNDFTKIRDMGSNLIKAKDGDREVFVWVIPDDTKIPLIPLTVLDEAREQNARIDLISFVGPSDHVVMRHMMNAIDL